jgi:hypothetical protein
MFKSLEMIAVRLSSTFTSIFYIFTWKIIPCPVFKNITKMVSICFIFMSLFNFKTNPRRTTIKCSICLSNTNCNAEQSRRNNSMPLLLFISVTLLIALRFFIILYILLVFWYTSIKTIAAKEVFHIKSFSYFLIMMPPYNPYILVKFYTKFV